MQTKTELHTHMMGMLSAKDLITFLANFDYCFPISKDDGKIVFNSRKIDRVPARKLLNDSSIINQLSIPHGQKRDYDCLKDFYYIRNALMGDLVDCLLETQTKYENPELKYFVYGRYLEECLRDLVSQKVEYVEISYSNAAVIENCIKYVDPSIFNEIKCKFLLSTDRSKVAKEFRQSSRHLVNLLDKNLSVGFDVMGEEVPFSALDMDRTSNLGLEKKLTPIIEKLNAWGNTTLRIHSGETRYSEDNTQKVLTVIERIEKELNIVIPPPEIRIGHGIHFKKNQEYLRLLKKYDCIVEINASSNYALDNVDEYEDIPYNYYLDNDVKVVICSDGHGMYDTNKKTEDDITKSNVSEENIKKIVKIDDKIRREK